MKLSTTLSIILLMFSTSAHNISAMSPSDFASYNLIDISELDSTIVVSLMYATTDNFVGENLYGNLKKAYLHIDAAIALKKASDLLQQQFPDYRLKICDAARPMSVQRRMFNSVKGTPKARYVANPAKGGGLHNYGLAVDITIVDTSGHELSMGTKVDHLGSEANITREKQLVQTGKISQAEADNRLLLRNIMIQAGFRPLPTEWWHFNFCSLQHAQSHYKRLDF